MACNMLTVFLLISATISLSQAAASDCVGGAKNGERVDRGRYWYTCDDGHLTPRGCFSPNSTRMGVYGSYHASGFVVACEYDKSGGLQFSYKACVHNGTEVYPGQSWQDDKFWYTCTVKGDSLSVEVAGCMFEGYRYTIGDSVERNGFLYKCQRNGDSSCSMCPVGCANDGKKYYIGDSYVVEKFWYVCTKEHGKLMKKCVGCVFNNRRLRDGDRYTENGSVFECSVRMGTVPKHQLVGCLEKTDNGVIERRLGCEWATGKSPHHYTHRCEVDNQGRAVTRAVRCFYLANQEGGFEVMPGCFRTDSNSTVVGCHVEGNNLVLKTYPREMLNNVQDMGLKFCF